MRFFFSLWCDTQRETQHRHVIRKVSHYTTRKKKNRQEFCTYYLPIFLFKEDWTAMASVRITCLCFVWVSHYKIEKERTVMPSVRITCLCLVCVSHHKKEWTVFASANITYLCLIWVSHHKEERTFCVSITLQERMNRHGFCTYYVPMFCLSITPHHDGTTYVDFWRTLIKRPTSTERPFAIPPRMAT